MAAYVLHAKSYYRGVDGQPTSEYRSVKTSLRDLRRLYEDCPLEQFGAAQLKAVRQAMIVRGWNRAVVNQAVRRIKAMFRWGVEEGLVTDPAVWHRVASVRALQRGRCDAPEPEPVTGVSPDVVERTLPYLLPHLAAVVRLQQLTGARPGEILRMRWGEIDQSGPLWFYRPAKHKNAWREQPLVIPLNAHAQFILRHYWRDNPEEPIFQPREAMAMRNAIRRAKRKTKVQPSQVNRAVAAPRKRPGVEYTTMAYGHAIRAACRAAGVPPWRPHQIRHAIVTQLAARHGPVVAGAAVGQKTLAVTLRYVTPDQAAGQQAIADLKLPKRVG
jgi:integrase